MRADPIKGELKGAGTFTKVLGLHYLKFLQAMHENLAPEWYLEIGTQTGASLAVAKCKSVSVDPKLLLKHDVWSDKPELHLYQSTSDDFFAANHLEHIGAEFDLAFLDGMHLFEYLLRDFFNTEPYMKETGHIVLHDCLPWSANMALRDRQRVQQRAWAGDVWKLVPILQKYRPDLSIAVYDAEPTGLVVVSDLDPENTALADNYERIIAEFDDCDGLKDYLQDVQTIPTAKSPWVKKFSHAGKSLHFAIKTNVPRPRVKEQWGDYHFAVGLKNALERIGHKANVRTRLHWDTVEDEDEVDLVLSGHAQHQRRGNRLTLQWLISSTELFDADHSFVASKPLFDRLQAECAGQSCSVMPQAFDADRIPLPARDTTRSGTVFVGLARHGRRPLVNFALQHQADLKIWGPGWEETDAASYVVADHLNNRDLGQCYANAEIVLNDHTKLMRRNALTSNRVFDALACATPVISDAISWMPEGFEPFVECVSNSEEYGAALDRIRTETIEKRKARHAFAISMRNEHSFDARAAEIVRVAAEKLG